MYKFHATDINANKPLFDAYIDSIARTGVNDDFWEGHISGSQAYQIDFSGDIIGLCGVYGRENLAFFYIPPLFLKHAQPAFNAMIEALGPQYSFAATNDELLVSLCMDKYKRIEMQAYFFDYGAAPVRPPEYPRELLALAAPADEADILDTDGVAENIALGKYYVMRKGGVFLGQGFLNKNMLVPNAASIGMSVHPDFRRGGVGRSIIMHMAAICLEQGIAPHCGCWYYNHNSKATLESAGFITQRRLLKIWLDHPD